jgi:hypothetical protein
VSGIIAVSACHPGTYGGRQSSFLQVNLLHFLSLSGSRSLFNPFQESNTPLPGAGLQSYRVLSPNRQALTRNIFMSLSWLELFDLCTNLCPLKWFQLRMSRFCDTF